MGFGPFWPPWFIPGAAGSPPPFQPIVFDWVYFQATYPELAPVGQQYASGQFTIATTFCANDGSGPVPGYGGAATYTNPNGQGSLPNPLYIALHQLTAHLVALNGTGILGAAPGQPSTMLVGRISSATEGSVTVQAEMQSAPGSAQWFNQTKYGAAYWQMTLQYRSFRYRAPPYLGARRWP